MSCASMVAAYRPNGGWPAVGAAIYRSRWGVLDTCPRECSPPTWGAAVAQTDLETPAVPPRSTTGRHAPRHPASRARRLAHARQRRRSARSDRTSAQPIDSGAAGSTPTVLEGLARLHASTWREPEPLPSRSDRPLEEEQTATRFHHQRPGDSACPVWNSVGHHVLSARHCRFSHRSSSRRRASAASGYRVALTV